MYENSCVDVALERLPIAAILNAQQIHDAEGLPVVFPLAAHQKQGSSDVATFDSEPITSLDEMLNGM